MQINLISEPTGVESSLLMSDGTNLRIVKSGNGPSVLLLHGLGANIQEWNLVWQQLINKGYQAITLDLRGHGNSTIGREGINSDLMIRDLMTVFDVLLLENVVVVGHSMGGFLLLKLLLKYPKTQSKIRGIILFASFAGNILKSAPQNRIQIPLLKSGLLDKIINNEFLGSLFVRSLLGKPNKEFTSAMLNCFRKQRFLTLAPIVQDFIDENHYPSLNQIQLPCVILAGERDKTAPPWHSLQLHQKITGSQLLIIPQKGHALNWEAPETLVTATEHLHIQTSAQ